MKVEIVENEQNEFYRELFKQAQVLSHKEFTDKLNTWNATRSPKDITAEVNEINKTKEITCPKN